MCNKSVNNFPSKAQIVAECYKTQENCIVDACPFVFDSVPDWYKTQEMCNKAVSFDPFMAKYCLK